MLKERGSVIEKLKLEEGVSKAGKAWEKQDFVIQTQDDKFPKKICFTLFGDKKDLISRVGIGEVVDVQFTVESRDFNGKWYHNLNAYAVDIVIDGDTAGDYGLKGLTKDDINLGSSNEEEGDSLPF